MNIQITGASGSGKTYLGKTLAKKLNYNFIDVDDIIWQWGENIQPYTVPVKPEDACKTFKKILESNQNTIASGIYYPWSKSLISFFDLLIVVETEDKIRKKRLIKREKRMYGKRVNKNGDMFNQFNRFLNWAMEYEYSDCETGSKTKTIEWAKNFKNVIYVSGSDPINKKIKRIIKYLNKIN